MLRLSPVAACLGLLTASFMAFSEPARAQEPVPCTPSVSGAQPFLIIVSESRPGRTLTGHIDFENAKWDGKMLGGGTGTRSSNLTFKCLTGAGGTRLYAEEKDATDNDNCTYTIGPFVASGGLASLTANPLVTRKCAGGAPMATVNASGGPNAKWSETGAAGVLNDQTIASILWSLNNAAVTVCEATAAKTTDDKVKQLARRLRKEHEDANGALEQTPQFGNVASSSANVPAAAAIKASEAAKSNTILSQTGANVEKRFLQMEVQFHLRLLKTADKFIPLAKADELKALLRSSKEVFQSHLTAVKTLAQAAPFSMAPCAGPHPASSQQNVAATLNCSANPSNVPPNANVWDELDREAAY